MGKNKFTLNQRISKIDMLLAIAMSEFHKTTHVLFIPPSTEYVDMLKNLVSTKYIEQASASFYVLTAKGRRAIKAYKRDELKDADSEIDKFVDGL